MVIRTKYDLDSSLFFIHRNQVRFQTPVSLSLTTIEPHDESARLLTLITYRFRVTENKKEVFVEKYENEVFKRRADLIRSFDYE